MVTFLNNYFENKDDKSKAHYLVNDEFTAKIRRKKHNEIYIKGCQKYHLIAANPLGQFKTMVHYQDQDSVLKLNFQFDDGIECEKSYETDEESVEHIVQNPETLFDIVETSTYISLLCPSNSLEILFVAEVLDKANAPVNITDNNGHVILAGEQYL